MTDQMAQAGMQEVNVDHVNAMLQVLTDQRNAALNTTVQLQAEVVMLRRQNEALNMQNQNLTNALNEAISKAGSDAEADKAATGKK